MRHARKLIHAIAALALLPAFAWSAPAPSERWVPDQPAALTASDPLTVVLDALTATPQADPPADPAIETPPGDRIEAMRLYASGGLRLHAGDFHGAIRDLQQAAELDPASAPVRALLGRARLAAGLRRSALVDFNAAVNLGDTDPIAPALAGLEQLRAGNFAKAGVLLARAHKADPPTADESLARVIEAGLGEALIETGYANAGVESLTSGLEVTPALFSRSAFRDELSALLRRKGRLRLLLGDAQWQLGGRVQALETYTTALSDPLMDAQRARARVLRASVELGHHTDAAQLVSGTILISPAAVDEPTIAMLPAVATDPHARIMLLAAIDQVRARPFSESEQTALTALIEALQNESAPGKEAPSVNGDLPPTNLDRAHELRDRQLFTEALARLDDDTSAAELIERGEILLMLGRAEEAETAFNLATGLDPFHNQAYIGQIAAIEAGGGADGPQRFLASVRALRDHLPASRVLRRLYAQDLIRSGRPIDAERHLVDLAFEDPEDSPVINALSAQWSQPASRARGIRVLRGLLAAHPGAVPAGIALARLEIQDDHPDAALGVLDSALAATGGDVRLVRAREALLREAFDRADEANQSMLDRLASMQALSIDEAVGFGEQLIGLGDTGLLVRTVVDHLPPDAELTIAQQSRLIQLIARQASMASMDLSHAGEGDAALALCELGIARGLTLSPGIHRVRMGVAARTRDAETIARIARQAGDQIVDLYPAVWGTAEMALVEAEREALIPAVFTIGAIRADGTLDAVIAVEAVRVIGRFGGGDEIDALIARLEGAGVLGDATRATFTEFGMTDIDDRKWDRPERLKGELAYACSIVANALGRQDAVDELLERALVHDPAHPWASNDRGYQLVELGRDLERAERLIEAAAEALPDRSSIIDSLGWLRYMQGRYDEAAELLGRAVELEGGTDSGASHEHLGDAQWRGGRHDEAKRAWDRARALSAQSLEALEASGNEEGAERVRAALDGLNERIRAAHAGGDPPVAKRPGEAGFGEQ